MLEITNTPNGLGVTENEVVYVEGTATDPDGDTLTATSQVGLDGEENPLTIEGSGAFKLSIPVSDLRDGSNIITIKTVDDFNAKATKQARITKTEKSTPAPNSALRFELQEPPTPINSVKVWVKVDPTDFDVEMYVANWPTGAEEWTKVEYEETVSPTGMKELYFEAIFAESTSKTALAFTKYKGIRMIIGGMGDGVSTNRMDLMEGAMMDLTDMVLGGM